jgi:hypothetical protein
MGTVPRQKPGHWMDLEGPFLIAPIPLAGLRAHGHEILAAIASTATGGGSDYAPFYGYGDADRLRPSQ